MNVLLLFFALPVATIILAIVLEKILRCPILTAATFFAIFLIVAFTLFDASFLVFAIVYTIIAFITAVIAEFFFRRCREDEDKNCCKWNFCNCKEKQRDGIRNNTISLSNQDIVRIAEELTRLVNNNNCCCNNSNDIATINVTNNTTGGRTTWCCRRK